MQIQLRINEEGLLRNQHHAFTNRFTLVTELLQNARRAGANRIDIMYDEDAQHLRVTDDGRGIADFQNLLTFYATGWDDETRDREHPFGIGFSKCLYASTRCVVTSRGHRIDFETASVLAREAVELLQWAGTDVKGTTIELHGVTIPGLTEHIENLCQGFPVKVLYNGHSLGRTYAEDHRPTMLSSMGSVHLADIDSSMHANGALVFLQGMCVLRPRWQSSPMDVVHLDPRQFMARLPDRDRLIDEDVQRERIQVELRACWRTRLLAEKRSLSAADFVDRFYPAMRAWGHLDLLNDLSVLPVRICSRFTGYPIQEADANDNHLGELASAPTREEIEGGSIVLADLEPVNDDNAACWMLARAKRCILIDAFGLDRDHWVLPLLQPLESQTVHVEAVGETHRTRLDGNWIAPEVVLCESVRVQVGTETASVVDAGVFHNDCLYIPAGETSGEPVRQVSTYTDANDQFLENDMEADREMLEELIRRLRAVDPTQLLDSMLRPLSLGSYPLLHGRSFQLTVGVGAEPGFSIEESRIDAGGHRAER